MSTLPAPKIGDDCIGTGLCESHSPHVFVVNDEGLGEVIVDVVDEADADGVQTAVWSCPVRAIAWDREPK